MKSLHLARQNKPSCLFPPQVPLPAGRAQRPAQGEVSALIVPPSATAQPTPGPGSWRQRSPAALPTDSFYEQHLIIHPFETFCIINPGWSGGRRLFCRLLSSCWRPRRVCWAQQPEFGGPINTRTLDTCRLLSPPRCNLYQARSHLHLHEHQALGQQQPSSPATALPAFPPQPGGR